MVYKFVQRNCVEIAEFQRVQIAIMSYDFSVNDVVAIYHAINLKALGCLAA